MPTYDYRCEACGHSFEVFHHPDEKVSKTCPVCKKRRVRRLIGAGAGVIFKGSGFYETDYRSSSYKASARKESGSNECSGEPSSCKGPCSTDKDS